MGKSSGNVDLIVLGGRKHHGGAFSEGRRTATNIYSDVQNFTFNYTAKLRLRMLQLIVKTP